MQNVVNVVVTVVQLQAHRPNELTDHGRNTIEGSADTRLLDHALLGATCQYFFDSAYRLVWSSVSVRMLLDPLVYFCFYGSVGLVDAVERLI